MQKLSIKKLTILNTIALTAICCFIVFKSFKKEEKTVYVDNIKLFDEFEMTKEMKRIAEKEFNSKKKIVDSLYTIGQSANLNDKEKAIVVQEFIQKRDELEQFGQHYASEKQTKFGREYKVTAKFMRWKKGTK